MHVDIIYVTFMYIIGDYIVKLYLTKSDGYELFLMFSYDRESVRWMQC